MVNALFIDYRVLVSDDCRLLESSVRVLKDVVSKVDDIRIICIGANDELAAYDNLLPELSQALSLKKTLFFDKVIICSHDAGGEVVRKTQAWMSSNEVKAFALVMHDKDAVISKSYPNNVVLCKDNALAENNAKDIVWTLSNFKTSISKDDNIWFVSDTHFGHANIIKYCNRPWNHGKDASGEIVVEPDDVLAMDNSIVEKWNSVVGKNDIVWHLGDFALGGKATAERVFPQLNGKINLVMGNHDHWKMKWYYDLGFHRVYDRPVIINSFVILSHAPLQFLNNNCPFYNVAGHVHDSPAYKTWSKTGCIVCVERHDYTPVSWKTIKQKYDELNGKAE